MRKTLNFGTFFLIRLVAETSMLMTNALKLIKLNTAFLLAREQ